MRTTVIIPDPLFKRAKQYARRHNKKLSELFSEALDERLTREEETAQKKQGAYRVQPFPMRTP